RERGQVEAARPPFGALLQALDVVDGQLKTEQLVQEVGALGFVEAEVLGMNFEQLAARAQTRQRQRRVGASRDRYANTRGQVFDEEEQLRVHRGVGDQVVVVEDEDKWVPPVGEVVEQQRQRAFYDRQPGRAQQRERALAQPGSDRPERSDHV